MGKLSREQRAREILKQSPNIGVKSLNKVLKEEFGVGIRDSDLSKIKTQVLERDVIFKREKQLIKDGFLPSEAKQLAQFPITTPDMIRYRTQRHHERQDLQQAGFDTKKQNQQLKIDMAIEGYTIGKGKKAKINAVKRYQDFASAISKSEKPAREAVDLTGTQRDIYNKWRKAGFTAAEAKELTVGKDGVNVNSWAVFGSEPAKRARLDRKLYIEGLLKRGWNKDEIRKAIEIYYDKKQASVWDFIRKDYVPKGKTSHSQDYIEAVRAKAEEITAKLYKRRK